MRKLFLLVAVLFMTGCTASEQEPTYLTVADVWANAQSLSGKQIRVRGWALFEVWITASACIPVSCDCNSSGGELELLEKPLSPESSVSERYSMLSISVSDASHGCKGNECVMACTQFDPASAEAFELVGTLRLEYWNDEVSNLILEDIDLETSLQLVAGEWVPIPQGLSVHRFEARIQEIRAIPTLTPFIITVVAPRSD